MPPEEFIEEQAKLRQLEVEKTEALHEKAHATITKIVKDMNGMSDEGFEHRLHSDPFFSYGYHVLVGMYIESRKGAV